MFEIKAFNGVHILQNILKSFPNDELVQVIPTKATRIGKIEIQPHPYVIPKRYAEVVEKFQNFSVREDDVWILTFPKSGTTWMQELCWLILNNYDFATAKQTDLALRSPFFEYNVFAPIDNFNTLELLEKSKSPRLIKSHLPIGLLPNELWTKDVKIIHVVRDPRDAILSHYHMFSKLGMNIGSLEEFLDAFLNDSVNSFWYQTLDLWKLRYNKNYIFVTFEEMTNNLASVINKTCTFLNKPITEKQMNKILEHLSFKNMKSNNMLNHNIDFGKSELTLKKHFEFMGKGQVGNHKIEFPPGYSEIFFDFHLYLES